MSRTAYFELFRLNLHDTMKPEVIDFKETINVLLDRNLKLYFVATDDKRSQSLTFFLQL